MRNARRARTIAVDRGKRRLDDGFGLRPRHQRGFVEPQRQAPEFLDAENARDRLAAEPPRGKRSQRARARRRQGRGRCRSSARCDRGRARGRPAGARRARANSSAAWRKASASARRACATVMLRAIERTASGAFGRQQLGLMLGDQRVDDLAQRLALHHLGQIVERQIDAVVGDAALREIVGADALGAVAASRSGPCRSAARALSILVFSAS